MEQPDWQANLLKNKVVDEEFDLSPLCHQQGPNVVGWALKCPNSLYGPLTMQASIKGVSGAWLEQRDPLGLMSAVQGTVCCSSSSLPVFIMSSTHVLDRNGV